MYVRAEGFTNLFTKGGGEWFLIKAAWVRDGPPVILFRQRHILLSHLHVEAGCRAGLKNPLHTSDMACGKISLARSIHCRPNFLFIFLFLYHTAYKLYELPLLPNNIAVKQFYTNRNGAKCWLDIWPFKVEAQTALFKDPASTAQ